MRLLFSKIFVRECLASGGWSKSDYLKTMWWRPCTAGLRGVGEGSNPSEPFTAVLRHSKLLTRSGGFCCCRASLLITNL